MLTDADRCAWRALAVPEQGDDGHPANGCEVPCNDDHLQIRSHCSGVCAEQGCEQLMTTGRQGVRVITAQRCGCVQQV